MGNEEELEFNPFYQILMTRYSNRFAEATGKCYMICVPESKSLTGVDINVEFVENHILRPSPFFQGQYLTTDSGNSRVVHLEDTTIKTGSGFPSSESIAIVQEELSYNKDLQPYKLLIIQAPIGVKVSVSTLRHMVDTGDVLQLRLDRKGNEEFLLSLDGHKEVVSSLEEAIHQFNTNYMVLEDYLCDTSAKLKSIFDYHSQYLFKSVSHPKKDDMRFKDCLDIALESFLLDRAYSKLYPVISRKHSRDDLHIRDTCTKIQHVSCDALGVPAKFACELPLAIAELKCLDNLTTPLEMLNCIKNTLDLITSEVKSHVESTSMCRVLTHLTSDDLIPLMVYVAIHAQCKCLCSSLFYIKHFQWAMVQPGDFSYSFVTLEAAVEYLKNTSFTKLLANREDNSKKASTSNLDKTVPDLPVLDTLTNLNETRATRVDRQLDRITRMLAVSTQEFANVSKNSPTVFPTTSAPPGKTQTKTSALGDFLGSLQNDILPSTYGKQT